MNVHKMAWKEIAPKIERLRQMLDGEHSTWGESVLDCAADQLRDVTAERDRLRAVMLDAVDTIEKARSPKYPLDVVRLERVLREAVAR